MDPQRILAALADLAPATGERVLDVSRGGNPIVWLGEPDRPGRDRSIDRLAALDELHRDERILRRGWAWVLGGVTVDGARRKVRLPLLAEPVRLRRGVRGYTVVPAGDLELTGLITDRVTAAGLEAVPDLGTDKWLRDPGAADWVGAAARAAGLEPQRSVAVVGPMAAIDDDALVGYAVAGLFVIRDLAATGVRDTLRGWASRTGLDGTALARVYGRPDETDARQPVSPHTPAQPRARRPAPDPPLAPDAPVLSPLPLSVEQREVVRRVRHEPVVVVSGPPGSGKSHAVVAAALDVVDRGGSVLMATQSGHAADVLATLLRRHPGPTPILFGDAELRGAIARELSDGVVAGVPAARLAADEAGVRAARDRLAALIGTITDALRLERYAAALPAWEPSMPGLRLDAPRAFEAGFDVDRARALLRRSAASEGPLPRLRRSWAMWRLRRATGASKSVPPGRLGTVLDAARAAAAHARLLATGGTDLGPLWSALAEADAELARVVGAAMRNRSRGEQRLTPPARRAATALGAALRAGRGRRRELLAGLDGAALVQALPLWIGTVTDVEDLLPPVPAMFDLVILDEAAHIDQVRAAPVLARARRALVVGDPRQLRFVSFVADVDVALTLARHGLDGADGGESFGDRLDVRRSSAFDVAAGAAPVTYLEEHYRCVPHLIEFSARRFYRDRIALLTRHPRNERVDAIDVVRVPGPVRVASAGAVLSEVDTVVATVRSLAEAGERNIGVITPFRGQADALEAALLAAFPVEEIQRLRLRTGTVHGFQGSEADTVVVSLGLVDGDSAARVRFAADDALFNVMVTRARRRLVVVTSLSAGDGLIGEYLSYAEHPPQPPPADTVHSGDWVRRLAAELRAHGTPVRVDYPVGRWGVDVCLGDGAGAVGLICEVHPDGVEAHLARHRALTRMGWRLRDTFASRWGHDPTRAAVELTVELAAEPAAGRGGH